MKRLFGILLSLIFLSFSLYAQSLDEAKKLYLEGRYSEAMPAFEKSLKSSPKNPSYNQWYGTCLLETGNLTEAEPYLKFAASKDIPEAFRSLGKLYYTQSRFEESYEAYEKYQEILIKKKQDKDPNLVESLLAQSKKAARMMSHCEDVQIIDSLIVDKNDFIRHYNKLSEESGTLQAGESGLSVIYENQLKDKRYYARQDESNTFRLYTQSKLLDNWSDETLLNIPVEASANNNYPFVLSDGVTLYYSSTGNGSLGGYDLFVTRYNLNDDIYLAPEQLGMPFNSIYNDYMMAIDEFNGVGYFATDRFQAEDKVVIYTFILNPDKKTIESGDFAYLRSRSLIESIKDSWVEGVNYASLLQNISSSNSKLQQKEKRDFDFVINDNIVYHKADEFENEVAKNLFIQSQSLNQQIMELQTQLDSMRQDYAAADTNKKQSLKSAILSGEKALDDLYANFQTTVVKARNAEIKYLRQQ